VSLSAERGEERIEQLAQWLNRWRLGIPAIALLEAHKPLSFVASQTLLAAQPLVTMLFGRVPIGEYAALLEDADNLERVIHRLEALEEHGSGAEQSAP
jgi:hypothetical protein